jgi:lipopolysaccharide biosynthesis regulator YciM
MTTPILTLARLKSESSKQEAAEFLLDQVARRPTVRGLEYLMTLLSEQGVSLDQVGPELVRELMQRLLEGQPRYRCRHCGFSGNAYHWLCPSCRRWNTTRAISGVLGE